jgi:pimeloyl-ACP methyl ester carboxylesterase
MQTESGFLKVEGGQLYYEIAGSGPALVLIHAGVANHSMWDIQFEEFANHFRVIRYDARGFGKTRTDKDASYSNRQDIKDLLNHLGIDKAYILGISRGGQIAIEFTLEFPERASALIPVAAGVGGYPWKENEFEMPTFIKMEELEKNKDWEALADLHVKVWVDGFYRDGQADPAVREKLREMCMYNFTHVEENGTPRQLTPPGWERLGDIKVPTLVIIGDIDSATEVEVSHALAEKIPGAKLAIFPGVAHMVNMEKPAEFNKVVIDFLTGIS